MRAQHVVKLACSEEVPEPVDMGGSGFSVAFDPLDGSSIVDTNFAVGTIVGIWPGDKLEGITGRDQVRAGPVWAVGWAKKGGELTKRGCCHVGRRVCLRACLPACLPARPRACSRRARCWPHT